ncbi:Smr/MutS family protein, partial [Paracoccus nototheniae]
AERLAQAGLRMDAKTHRKMSQGKIQPQARLDLHGLTLSAAQPELMHFVLSCHASGLRLVLVITGKGRGDHGPLPTRPGALRHQVPYWLHSPPLAQVVQQVTAAHYRHGGEGAYYVYLRRAP